MLENSLTVWELNCLAILGGRNGLTGIPDVFSGLSEEEADIRFRETVDGLLEKKYLQMDMEGAVRIGADGMELLRFCCHADRCLMLEREAPEEVGSLWVFWRLGEQCLMAEVQGENYVFSTCDPALVRAFASWNAASAGELSAETQTIPMLFLKKAARAHLAGRPEEANRILRQNGADDQLTKLLMTGWDGKGYSLRLRLSDDQGAVEKLFVSDSCCSGEAYGTVENYRNCLAFTGRSAVEIRQEISIVLERFFGKIKRGGVENGRAGRYYPTCRERLFSGL